ncbi:MAG: ATPase, T2SS/T4P/T4SS family [Thermoproteota archaeon]
MSQRSTYWLKGYATAIRSILDEIYIKSFSGSYSDGSIRDLCQVYLELGEIYDGSLIWNRESTCNRLIDRIIQNLPGTRKESLSYFARRSLLRALRGIVLNDVQKPALVECKPVTGGTVVNELDAYRVGPLSIRIVENIKSTNPIYSVSFVDHRVARLVFELSHLLQLRSRSEGKYLHDFRELIDWRRRCAEDQISLLCVDRLPNDLRWGVCSHAAYSSVGLRKYYALLVDDRVNEFYLDAPSFKAYLDHEKWNRCLTNIRLNKDDVEHFVTHLRRETNQRLDYSIPSIKADLLCADFNVRASIDASPLTRDGTAIDVRRYRREPMTILDLISNRTLSIEATAFILFSFIFRRSMSVVGEPNSGKTTLVNAIDLCAPSWWRKVTIEDVVESVSQLKYGRHQLRIQVDPLEQGPSSRLKSVETTRLLHRNPTYVLLGEVQTAEHSKALFQALASGLRVVHTVHASSSEGLIRRFLIQHNVSKEDLKSIELIILIKNFMGFRGLWRKVTRISELVFENDDQPVVNDIFRYDFEADELLPLCDLYQSNIVKRILEEYPLKKEDIGGILSLYKKFLESLVSGRERLNYESVLKKFDSFNSMISKKFHLSEIKRTSTQEATIGQGEGAP